MQTTAYVGLDVHKATISVAVAEDGRGGAVRFIGTIPNTPTDVLKLVKRLAKSGQRLEFCYEAGGCGYGLYRQIVQLGHGCTVVAPSMIPRKPGDRIKTDRRDAAKLAVQHRSGDLTAVWVPDEVHKAMRDLVRARIDAVMQLMRARQQCLALSRFETPRQLMAYLGLVPSEQSSGARVRRSGITKTGNREARRMLVEAAWSYRYPARVAQQKSDILTRQPKRIRDIAWKAQTRLCQRYRRLSALGKRPTVVVAAIARELSGFIWAIGKEVTPAPV